MGIFIHNTKLVFRNAQKNKRFFLINVLSLAIGMVSSCLLWLHISYERSYDKFYHQTDDLYRVSYNVTQNGSQLINSVRTPTALSVVLPGESSLVDASCRAYYEDCYMYTENVKLFDQKVVWADSSFLSVFQLDMVLGDQSTSLVNKYSVVISDKISQIYFGKTDPIGKIIKLNEGMTFSVTGVFKALPSNTHLYYDFILSFSTFEDYGMKKTGNWENIMVSTYIRKKQTASVVQLENTLSVIVAKYMADRKGKGQEVKLSLMPVKDIYLHSNLEGEFHPQGNIRKLTLLTVIALFLIVISWANNINISTALSFERIKQSGILKLNGANKMTLFGYYITESIFINLMAILLSVIFLIAALPTFKYMVNGAIEIDSLFHFGSWMIISVFLVTGVLLTGIMPAFIQSSFNTIQLLKNNKGSRFNFNTLRKSLAVFQFILAVILIGSTVLILKQIYYLESMDLGIKANQVLVMRAPATNNTTGENRYIEFKSFRQELLRSPYFVSITATMNVPGQTNRYNNIIVSRNSKQIDASFNSSMADENYFETYQVPVVEGRNFYGIKENELNSIIINEKAVEAIGFETASDAIGKKIKIKKKEKEIVGVVKNFHHESLQKELEPYIYEFNHPHEFGYYPARINTANIQEAINTAEKVWKKHYPAALFDSFFLDAFFNKQYVSYKQLGKIVGVGSFLAILIACMGLFALASLTINRRIKEIGVRKVNGATISEVMILLNRDFVKWVIVAIVIATPIAYYAMNKWLENFAYKTSLSWWIFALAGLLALGIALLTVSFQSWKAATKNPVEALRYE